MRLTLVSLLLTALCSSPASATDDDVVVAGGSDGVYVLSPSFQDAPPPENELRRIAQRTLYLGNRAGEIGTTDGSTVSYDERLLETSVSPKLALPAGEVAGRDRPTKWFKPTDGMPASATVSKIVQAQLDALGPGAAMKSAAAWEASNDGLLVLEVTVTLPPTPPEWPEGREATAIYLFSLTSADWMLGDVMTSLTRDDHDMAVKQHVMAVGQDLISDSVCVFVRRYWYEWEEIEQLSAGPGGFWRVSSLCFGIC
jgi:hypothetical protein